MEERTTPAWAERMVRFLDDGARVPGTDLRFGLDAIVGALLPGAGDVLTGTGSLSLLAVAWRKGVPARGLAQMLVNIAIDTVGGSLPVLGDIFDLFFKANRRNLELIERYQQDPAAKRGLLDYALVAAALVLIALTIVIPFVTVGLIWSLLDK